MPDRLQSGWDHYFPKRRLRLELRRIKVHSAAELKLCPTNRPVEMAR
jgi:hypothetical protein